MRKKFKFPFQQQQQNQLFLQTGPSGEPASSPTEDLELTRQIILAHVEDQQQQSDSDSDSDSDSKNENTSNDATKRSSGNIRTYQTHPAPSNDLMIRAALGRSPIERTPIWLFRQAGRHLPEYHSYKNRQNRNFLDMLSHPTDVAECTLQPLRRYPVDAAILFSDILVIAEALNVEVTMPGGVGIQVPDPLSVPEDVETRLPSSDEITEEFVQDKLGTVLESVKLIREKMTEEGIDVPLIGFSAAPWTLLFYMVGGSSRRNKEIGMTWLKNNTEASKRLLEVLTKVIIEYMSAQVEAGAHMLQLFEAMGMMIGEEEFMEFALPCLEKIGKELKTRFPDVPLMVFSRGACFANEKLSQLDYDVVTIDGSVDRATARDTVGDRVGLQGNYDPKELILANGKSIESVRHTAKELLEELGPQRLIANLGEGLGGKESPMLVRAFVDAIHEESEAMIQSAAAASN